MRFKVKKCFEPSKQGHHCHYTHNNQQVKVALDESRFFYNPSTKSCETFIYGIDFFLNVNNIGQIETNLYLKLKKAGCGGMKF